MRLHSGNSSVAMALVVSISGLFATTLAVANHFILPCEGDCARGGWVATQSMHTERELHTATLLPTGKLLVVGGRSMKSVALDSAELYDPVAGTWSATGDMTTARASHTATLLLDGRVLVAGGISNADSPDWEITASSEIYDLSTGTWTASGPMTTPRYWFDAAVLPDGRVLVAGGPDKTGTLASAEIYDPRTGRWSPTGSLNVARYGHTLTALQDGTVLAVRGSDSDDLQNTLESTELYDPRTGTWALAGDSGVGSILHTATLLTDGKVLVAGGNGGGVGGDATYSVTMLYDSVSRTWSRGGDLPTPVYGHAATLLPDGEVLLAGGAYQVGSYPRLRYVFDPMSAMFARDRLTWQRRADVRVARNGATMTLLPDGTVLLVGGSIVDQQYGTRILPIAERFALTTTLRMRPTVP